MHQPHGWEDGSDKVILLKKSLYGLKQVSRLWNLYMVKRLTSIGFRQVPSDSAVFVRDSPEGYAVLAVHVDNMLSFADSQEEFDRVRKQIHSLFEMTTEDPD